ncbi:hypothetical protein CHISP_1081 [Chitinispirillum alkaliphilum]|nr:hypothetical protein CHISP_1081 [Chitinispirillum alkaliphilum]
MRILFNSSRPRTLEEKINITKWLKNNRPESDYLMLTQTAGISSRERYECELLIQMEQSVIGLIRDGHLDSSLAQDFSSLPQDQKTSIKHLFTSLPFTRQNQRELLQWLPELSCRENRSIEEILRSEQIETLLTDQVINAPQKVQKLRAVLYQRRFPIFSSMEQSWKSRVKQINPMPSNVQFTPSPGFEKKGLEIRITLNDAKKAEKLFSELGKVSAEEWDYLILPQNQ